MNSHTWAGTGFYDWEEAIVVACRDMRAGVFGYRGSTAPFTIGDVDKIVCKVDGENDTASWVGVFRLNDGRFAAVHAWCDYTGWGCSDGGSVDFANTAEEALRLGLDQEERARIHQKLGSELLAGQIGLD